MTLTVKELENLTASDVNRRLTDKDGIYGKVRARKDGSISVLFRWRFRFDGKPDDFNCGTWPGDSLQEIRKEREWAYRQLQEKRNPNTEKKLSQQREAAKQHQEVQKFKDDAALAVRVVAKDWQKLELTKRANGGRKDNGAEAMRSFEADVFPSIGDVPVTKITRAACMTILNNVKLRNKLSMANHLFADMAQFFLWCETQGLIPLTPLRGINKKSVGGKMPSKERYLSLEEIAELKAALPKAHLQNSTEIALWIMLATATRVGEISRAKWDHIDEENRTWTIPSEHSKNKKKHSIHLSDFALEQFRLLKSINGTSVWCFPASNKEGTHVSLKAITKQVHDRQRATPLKNRSSAVSTLNLTGGPWTPHDLRRTAATQMKRMKVAAETIEGVLNHSPKESMVTVYQIEDEEEEIQAEQDAWTAWGARLEQIYNGTYIFTAKKTSGK